MGTCVGDAEEGKPLYSLKHGVLSRAECAKLCKWCDAWVADHFAREQETFTRVHLVQLPDAAKQLVEHLVLERILRFAERHVAQGHDTQFHFTFSGGEPAIIRYAVPQGVHESSGLKPHTDDMALTILVPLDQGHEGGGTLMWPRGTLPAHAVEETASLVRPPPGCAVLWDGDVLHMGRPITSGVRRVLVCSLTCAEVTPDARVPLALLDATRAGNRWSAVRRAWHAVRVRCKERTRAKASRSGAFWEASLRGIEHLERWYKFRGAGGDDDGPVVTQHLVWMK